MGTGDIPEDPGVLCIPASPGMGTSPGSSCTNPGNVEQPPALLQACLKGQTRLENVKKTEKPCENSAWKQLDHEGPRGLSPFHIPSLMNVTFSCWGHDLGVIPLQQLWLNASKNSTGGKSAPVSLSSPSCTFPILPSGPWLVLGLISKLILRLTLKYFKADFEADFKVFQE